LPTAIRLKAVPQANLRFERFLAVLIAEWFAIE